MDRFPYDFRNARRGSAEERSVLEHIDHFVDELDRQLDRLRADTRAEWRELRRFTMRTRRELDRFVRQSDRPVSKIAESARELGRELRKSLDRLS